VSTRTTRATRVVTGQVLVAASSRELETAEAVGLAGGRVVDAGTRQQVIERAIPSAELLEVGPRAVVPGIHDFHLHLVGMARARLEVQLDGAVTPDEMVGRVATACAALGAGAWLRGRGWRAPSTGLPRRGWPRRLAVDRRCSTATMPTRPGPRRPPCAWRAWTAARLTRPAADWSMGPMARQTASCVSAPPTWSSGSRGEPAVRR
jgi:hypothetical protein